MLIFSFEFLTNEVLMIKQLFKFLNLLAVCIQSLIESPLLHRVHTFRTDSCLFKFDLKFLNLGTKLSLFFSFIGYCQCFLLHSVMKFFILLFEKLDSFIVFYQGLFFPKRTELCVTLIDYLFLKVFLKI